MRDPAAIMARLEAIDEDLALRQNEWGEAAGAWFREKREQEVAWASAYMSSHADSVTERRAAATLASANIGKDAEANYEALRAVVKVLEVRAMIGMALLKAHGRA